MKFKNEEKNNLKKGKKKKDLKQQEEEAKKPDYFLKHDRISTLREYFIQKVADTLGRSISDEENQKNLLFTR